MKAKDAVKMLNGKKTPIILLIFIVTTAIAYGALQSTVEDNTKELDNLKGTPAQIARIEERVGNIDEHLNRFEGRQEKFNEKIDSKIDRILEAVR